MPAAATNIVGSNYYSWNGQWSFTSDSHPGMWNPQKLALQPRAGIALKSTTALLCAWAMPCTPFHRIHVLAGSRRTPAPKISCFWNRRSMACRAIKAPWLPCKAFPSRPSPIHTRPTKPAESNLGPQLRATTRSRRIFAGLVSTESDQALQSSLQRFDSARISRSNRCLRHLLPQSRLSQLYTRVERSQSNILTRKRIGSYTDRIEPLLSLSEFHRGPGPLYNQPTVALSSLLVKYPQYGPLFEVGMCCCRRTL